MVNEKIKITRKEIDELYDIEETPQAGAVSDGDVVTISENVPETWEEMTERKDKEKYGS